MIRFLRQIRQKLLQENRFSKYLLYAIGEIVLVVIGILIALQINNWNERKNRVHLEKSLLKEIKENLQVDLGDLRFNIKYDSTNRAATTLVLQQLENKIPYTDSLATYYGKMGSNSLLLENTAAYENLKTLGFDLISNKTLRNKISHLYSARYEYLDEISQIYSSFLMSNLQPVLLQNTSTTTADYFQRHPNNYLQLSNNAHFMEALRQDLFFKKISIALNKRTEKEILELIALIDKEIAP